MAFGPFEKTRYGLDIGGSSMVLVGISGKPGALKLRACLEWPLSSGLVVDGEIAEPDLFARELRNMVLQHKLRGRFVELAVSNQKVIVRNIDMPDMTEEELAGAIQFQAQDYIPIPIDEVVLDFQVLGKRFDPDGSTHQEVLLVAVQKTMVMTLLSAVKQGGLRVSGIDVSSLALVRALAPEGSFLGGAEESGRAYGIADISSSVLTLVVVVQGVTRFTRVVNFSSDRFVQVLNRNYGIPFLDAEMMMQRIGLPGPIPPAQEYYADEVIEQTQSALQQVASELAEEMGRSFDYYQSQGYASPVSEVVLSGKGALVRNLDAYLAQRLGLPVVIGNPLVHIAKNDSGQPDAMVAALGPRLAIAIGLALPEGV